MNVNEVFQEDEEANVISGFNGFLVTMPTRGIRFDFTLLHVDMMVDSITSHEKLSLMDGFSRYSKILVLMDFRKEVYFSILVTLFSLGVMLLQIFDINVVKQNSIKG